MSISNLARNLFKDIVFETPVDLQPLQGSQAILPAQETLFDRSGKNGQRRDEPDSENLAGSDGIPVICRDNDRTLFLQRQDQRFGLPGAQPKILREPIEDFGLPDLLDDKAAFSDPLLDEHPIGPVQVTRRLLFDSSGNQGTTLEIIQKEIE
jgi:hypothetical protein